MYYDGAQHIIFRQNDSLDKQYHFVTNINNDVIKVDLNFTTSGVNKSGIILGIKASCLRLAIVVAGDFVIASPDKAGR